MRRRRRAVEVRALPADGGEPRVLEADSPARRRIAAVALAAIERADSGSAPARRSPRPPANSRN
jgi:hypothetical protein